MTRFLALLVSVVVASVAQAQDRVPARPAPAFLMDGRPHLVRQWRAAQDTYSATPSPARDSNGATARPAPVATVALQGAPRFPIPTPKPDPTKPQAIKAKQGQIVKIEAPNEKATVDFDKSIFTTAVADSAGKILYLDTPRGGTFAVTVWVTDPTSGKPTKAAVYAVTIEGAVPPDPGPMPIPISLKRELDIAYARDVAAKKASPALRERMRDIYIVGSKRALLDRFKTLSGFFEDHGIVSEAMLNSSLPECRQVVKDHLNKVLAESPQELDGATRDLIAKTFLEIADALAGGPIPPDPGPDPPSPATGLHVILVYESMSNMTQDQIGILNSTRIADYLNEKTAKSNGRPGWRRWDKDIDTDNETEAWKKIWSAVKPKVTTLPAIAIVSDQGIEVVPFPVSEAATLELLKKYGR